MYLKILFIMILLFTCLLCEHNVNAFEKKIEEKLNNNFLIGRPLESKEIDILYTTNLSIDSIFTTSDNNSTSNFSSSTGVSDTTSARYSTNNIMEVEDELKYIPAESFLYADTRRYIITGGTPLFETKIKPLTLSIFSGTLAGVFILQHQLQMNTIWKEHSSFEIKEDYKEELLLDKAGHFYGVYATSYLFREVLVASGFGWNASNNWGAALGTAYSTYVEILDGFGKSWGFSPSDWYADVAGGLFFAAQNYFPFLQNFTPKFMFVPSKWTGNEPRIPHEIFIDDYSSQTFFMSINIYNLLPEKWQKWYPDWLELSVGYAVRNLIVIGSEEAIGKQPCGECITWDNNSWGSPRLIFALDYNMAKMLPDGSDFWNWFKQTLNLFKLPSPAIEIGKKTRFYLLFPFKI